MSVPSWIVLEAEAALLESMYHHEKRDLDQRLSIAHELAETIPVAVGRMAHLYRLHLEADSLPYVARALRWTPEMRSLADRAAETWFQARAKE